MQRVLQVSLKRLRVLTRIKMKTTMMNTKRKKRKWTMIKHWH